MQTSNASRQVGHLEIEILSIVSRNNICFTFNDDFAACYIIKFIYY